MDTGAGLSVISPEFCKFLNLVPKKGWEGPKLLTANGGIVSPEGSVSLEIFVEGIPVYVEAAVLPINGYKLLLGNDALRQLDAITVAYKKGGEAIFSTTPEVEMDSETEGDESGTIVSRESRVIPAYSVVAVSAGIHEKQSGSGGTRRMIEPRKKLLIDKGFSVGNMLLPSDKLGGTISVNLVNFSRSDQWLNEGTVLGGVIPVEVAPETEGPSDDVTGTDSPFFDQGMQFDDIVNSELSYSEREAAKRLLQKRSKCFASSDYDMGKSNMVQHSIDTSTHKPIHQAQERQKRMERKRDYADSGTAYA